MVNKTQQNKLKEEQINLLINKGIVKKGIFINVFEDDFDYRITDINDTNFVLLNVDTKQSKTISYKDIRNIEDMDVERILQAYMVDDELSTHHIKNETNISKNVLGKKHAKIDDVDLEDGIKFILYNDSTSKFNNKILTVSGVGSSIKLSAPRGRPKKNG